MPDIHAMIRSLQPEDLAVLLERGQDQALDHAMLDAIDRAAGGPGEGRGYYIVRGSLHPQEKRHYYLRDDVAEAMFGTAVPAAPARSAESGAPLNS